VKKIAYVVLAILMCLPGFAQAMNVYVEGGGHYGNYADAKKMSGFAGGIGVGIAQNTNIYLKYFRATGSEKNSGTKPFKYQEDTWFAAGEYNYPIKTIPIMWTSSLGVGYSRAKIHKYSVVMPFSNEKDDSGIFMGAWTGIRYIFSQRLSIYSLIGYHRIMGMKGDMINNKIQGFQIALGITATIRGENNELESDF
jgi:hypothetical protein